MFSIVDVPGHSDYFKNTVNGFSNVDGVLFCVDTTQGWSQQSEEHFLSLQNLGINNLLFFLTPLKMLLNHIQHLYIVLYELQETTDLYIKKLEEKIPFWNLLTRTYDELELRIHKIIKHITNMLSPPLIGSGN